MRFKLTLQLLPEIKGRAIPINYQYELSSAIYRILSNSDEQYAQWLHDNGFESDNKKFKLFSFSRLIAPYGIDKEKARLILKSNRIEWYIGILPEKSTQEFIQGIFKNQQFDIADTISGASFMVREVQMMPELNYTPDTVFETMSPICITYKNERGKTDYLAPSHPLYEQGILSGLLARYKALTGSDFEGETFCKLQTLSEPRSSLITIKKGTKAETRVRGYSFRFKLELPEQLMLLAYNCGIGEKGSQGFGMIKTI